MSTQNHTPLALAVVEPAGRRPGQLLLVGLLVAAAASIDLAVVAAAMTNQAGYSAVVAVGLATGQLAGLTWWLATTRHVRTAFAAVAASVFCFGQVVELASPWPGGQWTLLFAAEVVVVGMLACCASQRLLHSPRETAHRRSLPLVPTTILELLTAVTLLSVTMAACLPTSAHQRFLGTALAVIALVGVAVCWWQATRDTSASIVLAWLAATAFVVARTAATAGAASYLVWGLVHTLTFVVAVGIIRERPAEPTQSRATHLLLCQSNNAQSRGERRSRIAACSD